MSMCKTLCVTNRHLAAAGFQEQIRKVARAGVDGIVLREKDLTEPEYKKLAVQIQAVCEAEKVPLILHTFVNAAKELEIRKIHLPLSCFLALPEREKEYFDVIGVSVHSEEEARQAQGAGASYLTAGHVFYTDCKKELMPKGLSFLEKVCSCVQIPVYAIGGITPENASCCIEEGAAGICLMSSLMKEADPAELLSRLKADGC